MYDLFEHRHVDMQVHEGSAVQSGAKYVMRSDVLYMLPSRRLEKSEARRGERHKLQQ